MFRKYVCIKQHDIKDCGAACLATIAKQNGLKLPISKIREIAGTDLLGTNAYGVIKAAEKMGFTAKGVKGDQQAFFEEFPLPAIAHVVVDQTLLHYMVIHKITKKEVTIADPAKGIITYTPEEFFEIWTGILILLVPATHFEKKDETKGILSRFFHLLIPQKRLLIGLFFASLLYTILGILGAFYFQFLLDDILPNDLQNTLNIISIGVITLTVFKVLLDFFRTQLLLYLSQKLDLALILGYYQHVLKLPMNFFGTRKTGEIISRLMDASKIRDAISGATLTIMIDTLMVVVGGAILYSEDSFLFAVTALLIPLYAAVVWMFQKPFERMNRKIMEHHADLNSYLVESINGIETVKAYNAEDEANLQAEKKFVIFLKSIFRYGYTHNVQGSLKGFLQAVGGILILWVGAMQVLKGNMTIGQLITFNSLLAYFLSPIQKLINLQPMMQTAVVAADRLSEILDLNPEKDENEDQKIQCLKLTGGVSFQNVDFRYGTRQLVLRGINFHVCPGEKVAIVGESGSGKTTIIKLLMNFYKPETGDILINDTNIQDIHRDTLRRRIAYISQETFFFSGSIRDNLCLGMQENMELEKIIEAVKAAKAHDFINQMPLRYQTLMEENGTNLSGGQRQRLAIARALLKKPDILVMDEATSNLDSTTERAISETVQHLTNLTTIIIAHRLSTIMRCDRIFVMEQGEILETGSHHELMAEKGKYYELWKDQIPVSPDDSETGQSLLSGVMG